MEFKSREMDREAGEKLTFKCPKCEFSKTKFANDAANARRQRAPAKKARQPIS
jgi:hypothetical protein